LTQMLYFKFYAVGVINIVEKIIKDFKNYNNHPLQSAPTIEKYL